MVTIESASIYSMNKAQNMAYEAQYSDGTIVRTVTGKDGWLIREYKKNGVWTEIKRYVVKNNKKRSGERMIESVKKFLA